MSLPILLKIDRDNECADIHYLLKAITQCKSMLITNAENRRPLFVWKLLQMMLYKKLRQPVQHRNIAEYIQEISEVIKEEEFDVELKHEWCQFMLIEVCPCGYRC